MSRPLSLRFAVAAALIAACLVACGRSDLLSELDPGALPPGACGADVRSDSANCGACGNVCPEGDACNAGVCTPVDCRMLGCVATQACCGTSCVDTRSDLQNCGGCGLACGPEATACQAGLCCFATHGGGTTCSPPSCACTEGQACCGSGCIDTTSDPFNCGGCGNVCPSGSGCVASSCAPSCLGGGSCPPGVPCCATGCSDLQTDQNNCGACGVACAKGQACVAGACTGCDFGPSCAASQLCCANGCTDPSTDVFNCGACGIQCGATAACVAGACVANEGAFDPIVNPTYLPPGVHQYTTITVPAGVTVYVAGAGPASGTLDLHATGAIVIDGTIDVSGGPGTQNTITSQTTRTGRAGSGGFTGEPYASAPMSAACEFVAGNPGLLGNALAGTAGSCLVASTTVCGDQTSADAQLFTAPVAAYGGGAGVFTGFRAYGSGGGGAAGGAPGGLGAAYAGESDCSGVSGGGGATDGNGGAGGGAPYDGAPGVVGQTQCVGVKGAPKAYVGGGAGGSIGFAAASDLAVASTFQTGSAGGGGSADYLNRPVFGGTSGGGGGGGALRLATPATITITGQLLANGGLGGDAVIGTPAPNCDPQPGAAGGGGSGGVVYLSAPAITVASSATVSAAGGAGGAGSEFATGGAGGAGGLGRVRLSVSPGACSLAGSFDPPLQSSCAPTVSAGFAYVGVYPD